MARRRPTNFGEAVRLKVNTGAGSRRNYLDPMGGVHSMTPSYGEKAVSKLGWERISDLERSLENQRRFSQRQKLARIK